jgi:hypothetical protein
MGSKTLVRLGGSLADKDQSCLRVLVLGENVSSVFGYVALMSTGIAAQWNDEEPKQLKS